MIAIDTVKIGQGVKALQGASKELREQLVGEETMTAIGEQAVAIIQGRTQSGRDADGQPFAPYDSDYAKRRAKKGRSTRPDLTFTGNMLGAMASKFVSAGKALIVFNRGEEAQKAAGNSHKRDFFDLRMDGELNALGQELDRRVNAMIAKLGLA